MKILIAIWMLSMGLSAAAQGDSSVLRKHAYTYDDTLRLARMNTSSTLMIGGGVGLCGVGSYLLYYGFTTYNTPAAPGSTTPAEDVDRNRRQGTAFIATGGLAVAGGLALVALGAVKKHQFKVRRRSMSLQAGLSPTGGVVVALHF